MIKKIQQLIFIGMAFSMILNSCSIEKRVYRSGYHIEWNKSKHHQNIQTVFDESGQQEERSQNLSEINSENETDSQQESVQDIKKKPTNEADKMIAIPSSEKVIVIRNEPISKTPVNPISETDVRLNTQKDNSVKNEFSPTSELGGGKSGWFMLIMGLVLIGIGFLFQSFLGVFGLILFVVFGLGGAIYFIIGLIVLIANG